MTPALELFDLMSPGERDELTSRSGLPLSEVKPIYAALIEKDYTLIEAIQFAIDPMGIIKRKSKRPRLKKKNIKDFYDHEQH
jgi:hypothetical protein